MTGSPETEKTIDITLYSYEFSPYAAKVRCFLGYKKLDYRTHYVNPLKAKKEIPLGHQIPVLKISDEYRNDSTPIGIWLDSKFPQQPLLPAKAESSYAEVMAVDSWVTAELIPLCFRLMLAHGERLTKRFKNASIGANGTHQTVEGGYPLPLRLLHPFIVPRAAFIRRLTEATDQSKSNRHLLADACEELTRKLDQSPYLAQQSELSFADLSAFAQFALPYLAGYDDADEIERYPAVMNWLYRIQRQLPPDAGVRQDLQQRQFRDDVR